MDEEPAGRTLSRFEKIQERNRNISIRYDDALAMAVDLLASVFPLLSDMNLENEQATLPIIKSLFSQIDEKLVIIDSVLANYSNSIGNERRYKGRDLKDRYDKYTESFNNRLEYNKKLAEEAQKNADNKGILSLIKKTFKPAPLSIGDDNLRFALFEAAKTLAKELSAKYGVKVLVVPEADVYKSTEFIKRSILNNEFFISESNPYVTAIETEAVLNYNRVKAELYVSNPQVSVKSEFDFNQRNKQLLDAGHAKRTEISDQRASELSTAINQIKTRYQESNNGNEPSANKLAELLNASNIPTPSGKSKWYGETVKRVVNRSKPYNER